MSSSAQPKSSAAGEPHRQYYIQKIKTVLAELSVHQKVFSKDDVTILNHCLVLVERAKGKIDKNFQLPTNAVQPLTIALKTPYALLALRILQELEKGTELSEQCKPYYAPREIVAKALKPSAYLAILTILLPSAATVTRVHGEYLTLLRLAKMVIGSSQPPASPVNDADGSASPVIIPSDRKVSEATNRALEEWKKEASAKFTAHTFLE